jgi:hypothetical protein
VLWSLGHRVEVTDFVADRVADLSGFDLIDERYVGLRLAPGLVPLVTHRHDGLQYPLLWAARTAGPGWWPPTRWATASSPTSRPGTAGC